MSDKLKGTLLVIISACVYGYIPFVAVNVSEFGCTPAELIFMRTILPLPILFFLGGLHRRKKDSNAGEQSDVRQTKPRISKAKEWLMITATALMVSFVTPVLLLTSYQYIPAGVSTTLHFIYPAFVYIMEIAFFHSKPQFSKVICYSACILGIYFVNGNSPANLVGVTLALLSGLTYAIYIVLLDKCIELGHKPEVLNFVFCLIGVPFSALYCVLVGGFSLNYPAAAWVGIIAYSLLATVIGSAFFQFGVRFIGGEQSAVYSCFEPITSVLFGCLIAGQAMKSHELFGSLLIIFAITLSAILYNKQPQKSTV